MHYHKYLHTIVKIEKGKTDHKIFFRKFLPNIDNNQTINLFKTQIEQISQYIYSQTQPNHIFVIILKYKGCEKISKENLPKIM